MDNAMARCRESDEAYALSFSKKVSDVQLMIHTFCASCPIQLMCLTEATLNDYYGVWGGKTRAERMELHALLHQL